MSEEMQLVEWKKNWRDEWLKWICGYANAQGGLLEIGKDDNGNIVKLDNTKKLLEDIPNKIKSGLGIVADVDLRRENGKPFIAITVKPYSFPVSYHGKYHYRSGATKQELTGTALDEFMLRKLGKTWDGAPNPLVKFKDLDQASFDVFREKALSSGRLSKDDLNLTDFELLKSLRLTEGDYLTNAAVLLFHKDPDKFIPGAFVKIGYFETESNLVYQDEIHGSLVTISDKVMDVLYTKYFKGIIHYEGIQRVDRYPVQQDSMREAILNSALHKSYMQAVPIQIKVFPDSVYIFNVGKLPDNWTVETLFEKHGSIPRNPYLAATIFRTGMVETWGRGIEKIIEGCELIGAPNPIYRNNGSDMSLEFIAPEDAILHQGSIDKKPNEADRKPIKADRKPIDREEVVLDFIGVHGGITNSDAREILDLADSTTKRLLTKMVADGKLKAMGDRRQRVYVLP